MEVQLLRYRRHNAEWAACVLASAVAEEAKAVGVILQPSWANDAKILVPGMTEAVFLRLGIQLRPFHVVIAAHKVSELQNSLQQLVYRQRPPLVDSVALGNQEDLQTWSYTIENTFVHIEGETSSCPDLTVTTNDARPKHRNPRLFGPRITSGGASTSDPGADHQPKSLEAHGAQLKKCQGQRDLHGVLQAFGNIYRDDLRPDTYCYTIVIDTCAKLGQLGDAERYWARMKSEGIPPNTVTFTCMMNACAKCRKPGRAGDLFKEMVAAGVKPTIVTYNVMINAYAQAGDLVNAEQWFMKCKNARMKLSSETFAPLIDACGQKGDIHNAKAWLSLKCRNGLRLDKPDFAMMVNAHANGADVNGALLWHQRMKDAGHTIEVTDFTKLIKACGKAGRKTQACNIFREQIEANIKPDHFNLVTFINVTGDDGRALCYELHVDATQAKAEFDIVGDAFNFEKDQLNRKAWKIGGYGTDALDFQGLIRKDFGGIDG